MHKQTLNDLQHNHEFAIDNKKGERRTLYVLWLTAITMLVEIVAGTLYGSMALLADGWHMGTHVAAFMIAIFAYRYARKHANNPAYSFGTGKVNTLGGFASAIALAIVALVMLVESLQRLIEPHPIQFNQAIVVAITGLLVNLISVILLKDGHHNHEHNHHHEHSHEHDNSHEHDDSHDHHHHDDNLKAAYLHVLADAMTSLLAIMALVSGKYLGWNWLDPVIGIVGAIIITRWSYGLLKQTSPVLLDASIEDEYKQAIKAAIENDADNVITDLHVWRISSNHYAAIIALVTDAPDAADHYRQLLRQFHKLSHITIEVNLCHDKPCIVQDITSG